MTTPSAQPAARLYRGAVRRAWRSSSSAIAIVYTDLLRPGGWPQVGAIVAIIGVIDALFAPRLLKRAWDEQDREQPVKRFWKDGRGRRGGRRLGDPARRPAGEDAGARRR